MTLQLHNIFQQGTILKQKVLPYMEKPLNGTAKAISKCALDTAIKFQSIANTALAKAGINLQTQKIKTIKQPAQHIIETKPLPLIFRPEEYTRKEINKKIWGFEYQIKKMPKEQRIAKDDYSPLDYNRLYTIDEYIHSNKGYTDNICDCIAAVLYNNDDAYMLHLCPGKHKKKAQISHMQQKMEEFVNNLQKDGKECKAFLFGGHIKESEKLHQNILEVLNTKGIEPDEVLYTVPEMDAPHRLYYDLNEGIIPDNYAHFDLDDLSQCFKTVNIH